MPDVKSLSTEDCYIGQPVFSIWWVEPAELVKFERGEPYTGWTRYEPGRTPMLWSDVVVKLPKNGIIRGRKYGKIRFAFKCELDAVQHAYQWFCDFHMTEHYLWRSLQKEYVRPSIEEATRVLRLLSQLETGCHVRHAAERRAQYELEDTEV